MKRSLSALVLALAFVACSHHEPYATSVGQLAPGSSILVEVADANVSVYKPAAGDPSDRFTVAAMALPNSQPAPPKIRRNGPNAIRVEAPDPLYGLLVRLPTSVSLAVRTKKGNVNVTDVDGPVDVHAGDGDVHIMVPGIAQASTVKGSIDATIGVTTWKGTLHFTAQDGDVTVYVPETASFHARLHTDDGTIFTDFGLRGTSVGSNETIDAPVRNGTTFGIDIESHRGTVRLLRLTPQA
jgi:hypothetical protein